jgi:hypothetical protein
MAHQSALGALSQLGVFRGASAVALGVSRDQLTVLRRHRVIERVLPDTYRMTAVAFSNEQRLRAALLWAGDDAAAAGLSAAELYGLEGVEAPMPEIVVPRSSRPRSRDVLVHRCDDRRPLLLRRYRGVEVTGVEPTLVALAASLTSEAFDVACEDARRRRLTSVAALRAHLGRYPHRRGVGTLRAVLDELDPKRPSRSTLEVKTSGSSGAGRSWRPTDAAGTTIPTTTNTTTRNGVSLPRTATASSSRRGPRSRSTRRPCSTSWLPRSPHEHFSGDTRDRLRWPLFRSPTPRV